MNVALLRELPRAGTRLIWKDLAIGSRCAFFSTSKFTDAFARWLPAEYIFAISSGRAALCLILQALAKCSDRREVVIPAYTCPTVALSVARAGLKVRLCDVDPVSGNLNVAQLAETLSKNTLAVIPVHMHGIPCDMYTTLALARQRGVFIVEDCAQAAGATLGGQKVGTFGDAAFFSLARGKGFTSYEGESELAGGGARKRWSRGAWQQSCLSS